MGRAIWRVASSAIAFSLLLAPASGAQPYDGAGEGRAEAPSGGADASLLRRALSAARAGRISDATELRAGIRDPAARKLALWATLASQAGRGAVLPDALTGWPSIGKQTGPSNWALKRQRIAAALLRRDYTEAYQLAADSRPSPGPDLAEAQFYAGWIALKKLGRPETADRHFAKIAEISNSPISQARAAYWRGRAADRSEPGAARAFYRSAAAFPTTFYGQLAAEKVGEAPMSLGADPTPTEADRSALGSRELVRALDLLLRSDQPQWVGAFAAAAASVLESPGEYVLLVDRLRNAGRQFDAMRVVRVAAQHGIVLPERGYPVRGYASGAGLNAAFVHALIRQESGFDPDVRSPVGARGLMQLMPSTAAIVARSERLAFAPGKLDSPAYNVRVGSAFLGSLLERFDGSYVLAAAAYNAGPGHIPKWVSACGDPRSDRIDPVDFIECIPLPETRNYVMRVMEGMQVYRAKLNSDHAVISLERDLSRGAG